MAASSIRRPIPAIAFILLLSLVSGLVWWRVLHRDPASGAVAGSGSRTSAAARPSAQHCVTLAAKPVAWSAPRTVTVGVLNAAGRTGLAGAVTTELKHRGFKAVKPGDDPKHSALTEVRYGPRYATAARLVQLYLPGSRLVATTSSAATVIVSVGTGYKALATSAAVSKAKSAKAVAVRSCR